MWMWEGRPGGSLDRYLEVRAHRIQNPVERLRFLRQAMRPQGPRFRTLRAVAARGGTLLLVVAGLFVPARTTSERPGPRPLHTAPLVRLEKAPEPVWLVESRPEEDVYSNGLRVSRTYEVRHRRRAYRVFDRSRLEEAILTSREEPAGIVYHTTESHQAPFEEEHNGALRRAGEALLDYVQRRRCYNYVIDRFGRVHRVVVESDAADHAGRSIWADDDWVYVNLNSSFLGVSFEARSGAEAPVTPAQIQAARILTQMLRSKYKIRAANCVVHAQVSVNPWNQRIGWHTDWARGFPFRELDLPDNYETPLPSARLFGFEGDEALAGVSDDRYWKGLERAEEELRRDAARLSLSLEQYREGLQARFRRLARALGD